jgi:FSR family fosmidomycin resistance protein-like MFS transporter
MARTRLDPTILRLASGHAVSDAYSNLYAPLLPLLIPRLGLSLTAAGTLAMIFQMAASVSQLGFGHLADRWRPRRLMVVGAIVSVSVMSLIGLAWSTPSLSVVLVVGGLGGAAFHPTAAGMVQRLGKSTRGLAMAVHITAGSVGYALAPVLFAPLVEHAGLQWTPLLALPGLLVLAVYSLRLPPMAPLGQGSKSGFGALRPYARPLFFLYLIVVMRTLTSLSLGTFVPVLLTGRGWSVSAAAAAASLYYFSSSVGGFIGGPLADRVGPRRVIAWSMVLSVPFLAVAPSLSGWPFLVVLALGGICLQSTLPVNITFAHAIAPVSAATVSSLMMGFAWGTGGLAAPAVGWLADQVGVARALTLMALLPLVAAVCAIPLPRTGDGYAPATDADRFGT